MVLAFGLDHIIVWSDRPRDPNASRYLDNTAATRGSRNRNARAVAICPDASRVLIPRAAPTSQAALQYALNVYQTQLTALQTQLAAI